MVRSTSIAADPPCGDVVDNARLPAASSESRYRTLDRPAPTDCVEIVTPKRCEKASRVVAAGGLRRFTRSNRDDSRHRDEDIQAKPEAG